MWCATPNARCWWCGTKGHGACSRCLPHSSHVRIEGTADRCLDLTAHESDVAQFAIIPFEQHLDRGATLPIGGKGVRPNADAADKSAPQIGDPRSRGALGYRGHLSSPIGFRPAKRYRWRDAA